MNTTKLQKTVEKIERYLLEKPNSPVEKIAAAKEQLAELRGEDLWSQVIREIRKNKIEFKTINRLGEHMTRSGKFYQPGKKKKKPTMKKVVYRDSFGGTYFVLQKKTWKQKKEKNPLLRMQKRAQRAFQNLNS